MTDETPMPDVKRGCAVCRVTDDEILLSGHVIVSPRGIAHAGQDDGDTECGKDTTGDGWWWPL